MNDSKTIRTNTIRRKSFARFSVDIDASRTVIFFSYIIIFVRRKDYEKQSILNNRGTGTGNDSFDGRFLSSVVALLDVLFRANTHLFKISSGPSNALDFRFPLKTSAGRWYVECNFFFLLKKFRGIPNSRKTKKKTKQLDYKPLLEIVCFVIAHDFRRSNKENKFQ